MLFKCDICGVFDSLHEWTVECAIGFAVLALQPCNIYINMMVLETNFRNGFLLSTLGAYCLSLKISNDNSI